jgi:RNA:NAD 2'-phosphotransferase (TPT1/KptA family)
MLSIKDAIERNSEHRDNNRLVRQYERRQLKLGKRLAYLLRYGAEKEGLQVDEGMLLFRKNRKLIY